MHAIDFRSSRKISGVSALSKVHSLNLRKCIGKPDNPYGNATYYGNVQDGSE
jgi:hypothetical protein